MVPSLTLLTIPDQELETITEAVEDLMKDVIKAMKEENLDDETILKTNIGWIYFWSDSFLRCFIKQKRTVCGSSRSPFALQKMKSQQETTHMP